MQKLIVKTAERQFRCARMRSTKITASLGFALALRHGLSPCSTLGRIKCTLGIPFDDCIISFELGRTFRRVDVSLRWHICRTAGGRLHAGSASRGLTLAASGCAHTRESTWTRRRLRQHTYCQRRNRFPLLLATLLPTIVDPFCIFLLNCLRCVLFGQAPSQANPFRDFCQSVFPT